MDLHSLMKQFAAMDGALVGQGPKHPDCQNPHLADEVASFLATYPALRRDQGYVDFLEYYGGAAITRPNNELVIDIFGFLPISSHIIQTDGPIVDNEGYITFCDILLHNTHEIAFSFDEALRRPWGIYRAIVDENYNTPWNWYCATFTEWLNQLTIKQGELL